MVKIEEKLIALLDKFGLEDVLQQNDLEDITVLLVLFEIGLIDLEHTFYSEENEDDEET